LLCLRRRCNVLSARTKPKCFEIACSGSCPCTWTIWTIRSVCTIVLNHSPSHLTPSHVANTGKKIIKESGHMWDKISSVLVVLLPVRNSEGSLQGERSSWVQKLMIPAACNTGGAGQLSDRAVVKEEARGNPFSRDQPQNAIHCASLR